MRWLGLAGGLLLAVGVAGLGWTLKPVLRAVERDWMAAESIPPPADGSVQSSKGGEEPMERLWMPAAFNQPVPTPTDALDTPATPVMDEMGAFFSSGERVVLRIAPPEAVNGGRSIKIAFQPGEDCEYGSGQACVSRHRNGQVILLTVHSGLGGEGEAFRSAVEGTGLNLAFYSFERIQRNLAALGGVPVRIQAGSSGRDDLQLDAVVRIPPARLEAYFARPFDESLEEAAQSSSQLQAALDSGKNLLIFEICGWQIPGEPAAPEVSPTTASIYLGVIEIQ
jgi:hypothetical protein